MIIAAFFLLLFIILFFLPLKLRIIADGSLRILLRISYWRIPVKRLALIVTLHAGAIPYVYLENKKVCSRIFPKKSKRNHRRVPLLHAVLKAYRTEKLHMDIAIGTEDAASTAYFVGVARTVICALLPRLRMKKGKKAETSVKPYFGGRLLSVKGECIISALPANIIRKMIHRKGG